MTGTDPCVTPGCPGDGRYSAPGRGHVEGCRHPVPPTDPATMAAWEALRGGHTDSLDEATRAVVAARPFIIAEALTDALHPEFGTEWQEPDGIIWKALAEREAEVRERIAAEIEASCLLNGHYFCVTSDGTEPTVCGRCADAAVAARGTA